MIKITTNDINGDEFESETHITGSAKEIIRDLYSLHDTIQKNTELALLYGFAIKEWESDHEDN